ncbi:hypothetical protein EYF80_009589 [Liparis tanakae]|uniref:Uncharacterized protein n=1 Tax=Liparis tanakae TaxID=230148 RepID=A0A4Z2IRV6_9TELE|nr:hypothetical protein EYF80_009589 [Liparis tanakae]
MVMRIQSLPAFTRCWHCGRHSHTFMHKHAACCSTSRVEAAAAEHHSTSLQMRVAVGCRRAQSEALSGRAIPPSCFSYTFCCGLVTIAIF